MVLYQLFWRYMNRQSIINYMIIEMSIILLLLTNSVSDQNFQLPSTFPFYREHFRQNGYWLFYWGYFLDLSKAFDTDLWTRPKSHCNWFQSYHSWRTHAVSVGQELYHLIPMTLGVPQGRILGPLLFLVSLTIYTIVILYIVCWWHCCIYIF